MLRRTIGNCAALSKSRLLAASNYRGNGNNGWQGKLHDNGGYHYDAAALGDGFSDGPSSSSSRGGDGKTNHNRRHRDNHHHYRQREDGYRQQQYSHDRNGSYNNNQHGNNRRGDSNNGHSAGSSQMGDGQRQQQNQRRQPSQHVSVLQNAARSGEGFSPIGQRDDQEGSGPQHSSSASLQRAVDYAQEASFDADAMMEASEFVDGGGADTNSGPKLIAGGQSRTVTRTVARIASATIALRAIGKQEEMPAQAMELLRAVASQCAVLFATDLPVMFKASVADTYHLLRAVHDLVEAVGLWELHLHDGPLPAIGEWLKVPTDASIGGGESLASLFAKLTTAPLNSVMMGMGEEDIDDDVKDITAVNAARFSEIIAKNRPDSVYGCQLKQKALLRSLRFVVPAVHGGAGAVGARPTHVVDSSNDEDDSGAILLLRFLYTITMWGGDRVGTTYARTMLAVRITCLFQSSPHQRARDEAHELLAYFIRYHSSDFCSHARLHVPDIALLVNAAKDFDLGDPCTWASITDAAAKCQSAFHGGDKRWMMQKVGTVVPRGLRGLPTASQRRASAGEGDNTGNSNSTVELPVDEPLNVSMYMNNAAPAIEDIARLTDTTAGKVGGGQMAEHDLLQSTDFSPMTCSGFSHLSVRETYLMTSQRASVGHAFKRRHSGDKALYERFLYRQLIVEGPGSVMASPFIPAAAGGVREEEGNGGGGARAANASCPLVDFTASDKPSGLAVSAGTVPNRGQSGGGSSTQTATAEEITRQIRRGMVKDLLRAALVVACPHRCPMMTASGPRRRLFVALVARAQMDLDLLTNEELQNFALEIDGLLRSTGDAALRLAAEDVVKKSSALSNNGKGAVLINTLASVLPVRKTASGDDVDGYGSVPDYGGAPAPESFRSLMNGTRGGADDHPPPSALTSSDRRPSPYHRDHAAPQDEDAESPDMFDEALRVPAKNLLAILKLKVVL